MRKHVQEVRISVKPKTRMVYRLKDTSKVVKSDASRSEGEKNSSPKVADQRLPKNIEASVQVLLLPESSKPSGPVTGDAALSAAAGPVVVQQHQHVELQQHVVAAVVEEQADALAGQQSNLQTGDSAALDSTTVTSEQLVFRIRIWLWRFLISPGNILLYHDDYAVLLAKKEEEAAHSVSDSELYDKELPQGNLLPE